MYKFMNIRASTSGLLIVIFLIASCRDNHNYLQNAENIYNLTTEEQLKDDKYAQGIENFYEIGEEDYFTGKANISIYYKVFKRPEVTSPAILISAGRTEASIKYKELIFDLYNNGYSVYIHDHRGQGLSGRMTDDPDMGYIDTFQYYIDDMKYFYNNMLKAANHNSIYLLAHSMGGAIGITYLEQNPDDFNAAAFSSPMLGLSAPSCTGAKLLSGDNPEYALGQGNYDEGKPDFKENTLTGSEIRYNRMNAAFAKEPKAKLGGATYDWVVKSCQQFDYMYNNIQNIQTPFIIFSAENEQIVDVDSHQDFVENAIKLGKPCEVFTIVNAQHELLMEKDKQRIATINQILKYFKSF